MNKPLFFLMLEILISRQSRRDDNWLQQYKERADKGIHMCQVVDPASKNRCVCSFLSSKALEAHEKSEKHHFESQNLVDLAVSIAGDVGGILAAGSHKNRLIEYNNVVVKEGDGLGISKGLNWYSIGCYCKP